MLLALFVLGLVQGLTEFLPVSSSGHIVLLSKIFGIEESLFLSILLHIATLLSIVVIFYKDIWKMIRHPFSKDTIMLAVATIPTCLIVLVLMPIVKLSFMGGFLPICFAITAILLLFGGSKKSGGAPMNMKTAFFMGVAQGFAVFPGISRSGSTIAAGFSCGGEGASVTKFSFLMSIPIILLSLAMEVFEILTQNVQVTLEVFPTIVAFLTAFLVGIFAIKFMLKFSEKSKMKYFSIYLVFISILSLFIV